MHHRHGTMPAVLHSWAGSRVQLEAQRLAAVSARRQGTPTALRWIPNFRIFFVSRSVAFHVWKKALGCTTFQPHWKAFFNPKAPLLAQKNDALRLVARQL